MNDIEYIKRFTNKFKRSKFQINELFESDSELLDVSVLLKNKLLAISTDTISEEIEYGIYNDPYLIGWMLIISNISDLAAVGALPFGVLLNLNFENIHKNDSDYFDGIQNGVLEALQACNSHVLGGDTNFSSKATYSATVLGSVNPTQKLMRKGCKEGDLLYSTGKLGLGNCFAANKIFKLNEEINFKPYPRLLESQILKKYASSCIDSSDGFINALAHLIPINNVGFILDQPYSSFIHSKCFSLSKKMEESILAFLAGILGEYELIFTIPKEVNERFLLDAINNDFNPVHIGSASDDMKILITGDEKRVSINYKDILDDTSNNLEEYIINLRKLLRSNNG